MRLPVKLEPSALRTLATLPPKSSSRCVAALHPLLANFGDPHRHDGIGVRKIGRCFFECRAGLDSRIVFSEGGGMLSIHLTGNHDDVARFIRDLI